MKAHFIDIIKSLPEEIVRIVATIFYTIKYNWFYILLSLLAPLIIYKMGAGREIVALLFDKNALFLNTFFLMLTLVLMSATIWLIPSLSIYLMAFYAKLSANIPFSSKTKFYQYLINVYGSDRNNPINDGQTQIPAKYLAMIPWTMVCATLVQFSFRSEEMNASISIFLALITLFITLMIAIDGVISKKKELTYWAATALVFVVALTFFLSKYSKSKIVGETTFEPGTKEMVILIYLAYILCMFGTFLLLIRGDLWYNKLRKTDQIGDEADRDQSSKDHTQISRSLKINNRIHALLFAITLGSLILLTALALNVQLPAVSSLTVLLLCLNFYMLIVDSLFTAQWVMSEKLSKLINNNVKMLLFKILIGVVFFAFIGLVFFNNTNGYKHSLAKSRGRDGENLESYFEHWYRAKRTNMIDTSRPMNVYLISGQGGGSRAAVYMLAVLREIEKSRDKELYEQTFSISSISGSSAGIGQYIGQHQNEQLQTYLKSNDNDARTIEQLRLAYSYNFFNSNLLGLLFYDRIPAWIKDIFYKTESKTYATFNRNYIQEKEELNQLKNFTDSLIGKSADDSAYSFFQNNIQDLYNKKDPYSTPLVFFNTTVLNRGQKGIFSPIVDDKLFCNNIDLLTEGNPVSFHFAEISSQSFPLLNNFSSFHGNYLGDGGIYENSGTSTTLQIYKQLRRYCTERKYKVRFIVINILNASEKPANSSVAHKPEIEQDDKNIISLLLSAVSKVPFAGHETDAKVSVIQEINSNNRYAGDSAVKDYAFNIQPGEQFALSRVFSPATLKNFISREKLSAALDTYSKDRKFWDSLDNLAQQSPTQSIVNDTGKIYRIYTQYRNKGSKEAVKALLSVQKVKNIVLNIPPIDLVAAGNYENEIRYFHTYDHAKAANLKAVLLGVAGIDFKLVYVSNKLLASKTPDGQLELWISSLDNTQISASATR